MNPDSQNTPRYHQQHQKAIEAAASVFAEKGYHGASTQDIASHMGIRQGSLYYYFTSKEAALEEVCLAALRDYVDQMEQISTQVQPLKEKLTAAIGAHLASYRSNSEALKVHNEQRLYLPEEKREKLKVLGSRYRQQLEDILIEGIHSGVLNKSLDCHFAALSLIGLCNYWGAMLTRDPKLTLNEITSKCMYFVLNGCLRHIN
ncbi:MAG: TetR/AcrR family transcriptional regulator [Porticoccus sp.]